MAENVGCDMHQRSARRVEAMTACRIAVQLAWWSHQDGLQSLLCGFMLVQKTHVNFC